MNTISRHVNTTLGCLCGLLVAGAGLSAPVTLPDTGQDRCYDHSRAISCPEPGEAFYGQDAQYQGNPPAYQDNRDGTVTDLNTGLVWSKAVSPQKMSLEEAEWEARRMHLGGYSDWRLPNIKELYSLIDFRGYTGFSGNRDLSSVPFNAIPFIDTDYFDFLYGASNERYIDAQWLSSTQYVSTTMGGAQTLFGVNFADGRIKGYGYRFPGTVTDAKQFYVRYVRGEAYGENQFQDNGDGTITDQATGLTWSEMDSGSAMSWEKALRYAQKTELAGYRDWRLPNAKELQYIVDYSRSPDTTGSAAIDPLFQSTPITNEAGEMDYPAYWSSTTHLDGARPGSAAVYVAFGRALGQLHGEVIDVHGAGAQRSDPKVGHPEIGRGPQGDVVRIENFVRLVRGGVRAENVPRNVNSNRYPYNLDSTSMVPELSSALPPDGMTAPGPRGFDTAPSDRQVERMAPGQFGSHFVSRLDRDGDGLVSREEFDGPPDRFDFHDGDGDGYLSPEEAPPPPFGWPGGAGRGEPPPRR